MVYAEDLDIKGIFTEAMAESDDMPDFLRDTMYQNDINLILEDTGETYGISMQDNEVIDDGFEDPEYLIYTTTSVIERISESDDKGNEVLKALVDDEIRLDGVGIINTIKGYIMNLLSDLILPKMIAEQGEVFESS